MAQTGTENMHDTRRRAGVKRMKKHRLIIDMTPMVDLGFLLISFFVITTELSKPTAMPLVVPKDGGPSSEIGDSYAFTVLLGTSANYFYEGDWAKAVKNRAVNKASISELRAAISKKQAALDNVNQFKEGRNGLMMLIKPTANASYRTVVDVLDEATITGVKKYAIIKISKEEQQWLDSRQPAQY